MKQLIIRGRDIDQLQTAVSENNLLGYRLIPESIKAHSLKMQAFETSTRETRERGYWLDTQWTAVMEKED